MPKLRAKAEVRKQATADRVAAASRRWEQWLASHPRSALLVKLIRDVITSQGETRASLASAGAAFWLVIAIFPAVTALVSIFGLVFDPKDLGTALGDVGTQHDGSLNKALAAQIEVLTAAPASSLSLGLVVSVALSLWSASNGTYNLLRAVRLSYALPAQGYVNARFRGYVSAVVAIVGLGVAALASAAIGAATAQLDGWAKFGLNVILVPCNFAIWVLLFAALYRYGVAHKIGFRSLLPGAVLATVGLFGLVYVLTWVVGSFGGDSAVYGVAAGAVSGLIAVYLAIYIVVLGAIINAHWPQQLLRRIPQ